LIVGKVSGFQIDLIQMSKGVKVVPLELSDSEVRTLIVETLLKAQEVFPKMKLDDLEIGSRQPAGAQGVLWAWRISTNLGAFDISNNHRLVRIAPEPAAKMKKAGKLPDVASALFSAWCPDWKEMKFDSDKKRILVVGSTVGSCSCPMRFVFFKMFGAFDFTMEAT
jgi:hypothetical protein